MWLYVQEYAGAEDHRSRSRCSAVAPRRWPRCRAPPASARERIHLRQRRKTTRGDQYEKLGESADFKLVEENGLRFWVNFTDYLDTGLFLDHRITRARLRDAACPNAAFLNLFAYTGQRHGLCGRGRRARHHDCRHVGHLPRLGPAQSGGERILGVEPRVHPGRLHLVAQGRRCRAPAPTT